MEVVDLQAVNLELVDWDMQQVESLNASVSCLATVGM